MTPNSAPSLSRPASARVWFGWWMGLALVLLKLWLVDGQTLCAVGYAGHDDRSFLELAQNILRGKWLGDYNQFTLMKGPGYPLWIGGVFLTGIPLFVAQQLFYAAACALVVAALRPVVASRWLCLALFAVLLFNPMTYEGPVHSRIIRQGIYHSAALAALAGFLALFTHRAAALVRRLGWGLLAGLSLALFSLTREEGVWLQPLILLVWGFAVWRNWPRRAGGGDRWPVLLATSALPWAALSAVLLTISTLNYRCYGLFGTVEFKAQPFLDAYGALTRVTPQQWRPWVPVQREVRERIYAVSPSFAELRPYLEGPMGEGWSIPSEGFLGIPRQQHEMAGGWFMWCVRDAVMAAGYRGSAAEAMGFYARVAAEVNQACEDGRLAASPRRSGFLPVWHPGYTANLRRSLPRATLYFLSLDGFNARPSASSGSADALVLFADMTRGRLTATDEGFPRVPPQQRWLDRLRIDVLQQIGHAYQRLILPVAALAALAAAAATVAGLLGRRISLWLVLNVGLVGACAAMTGINALVDATSFPTISVGGFTACYPLYFLFLFTAGLQAHAEWRTRRPAQ